MKCLVAFGVLGLITTACGTEQSPSFTEKRDSKTIRLTVEADPEAADEDSTSRESLDEMDVGAVLDAAYDDTAPSSSGDSPTGIGSSTSGASGDGSPSSSDATAATGGGIIVASADGSASADLADASMTGGSAADSGATAATADDGNEGELGLPTSGGAASGSGDEGGQDSGAGTGSTGTTAGGSSTGTTAGGSSTGTTAGGSSTGGSTGGSTSDGSTGSDMPTEGELRACAKLQGVSVDRVKVAGNQNNMSLTSSSVAAIKITGNRNSVSLMLAGAADARLAGVCIFLAGNQAHIDVDVGLNLERLVYVARGNQSHGELALSGNGTIGAMAVDLSGNGASLHISGDGAASICDAAQVRQKGNGTKLLCN